MTYISSQNFKENLDIALLPHFINEETEILYLGTKGTLEPIITLLKW